MSLNFQRLAVVSNQAFSLLNFRGELIRDLVAQGAQVYAFAPDHDSNSERQLRALGAIPVDCPIDRMGMNPFSALRVVQKLARMFRALSVDAVFSYFAKPVIYAGFAARLAGIRSVYSMIEGAGYVYSDAGRYTPSRMLLRCLVGLLYRASLRFSTCVFLLNDDDRALFVGRGLVAPGKVMMLPGIGLNLEHFRLSPPILSPIVFVFVGRLLREKGVEDFVAAARLVKQDFPQADFVIVGDTDANPDSLRHEEIQAWATEGLVRWVGHVADVRVWLARASVFVLPSYYREGLPRSTQEAMALGRPVITTDWVGCRESIENGVNGFLVPVRSPASIANAMRRFIAEPELIVRMGYESRRIAEIRFDVREINKKVLAGMYSTPHRVP
ncbi:glycosyltransferase family 4 protein [Pseudomonas jinjuensis]|uniref:Glycosyltransferase involved in cell wall bisynthesis n=1 Tax=Pseudomonas jinjuensis TaxID=198616 RepID=A0A1G9YGR6_9PSED|nr:glycosyltransferase family 4 protein [Pseudomonas jinjuensis]SDN07715.1 Glycosyltransferase involved in cell wall bisynthesis [Pseudomonas jinjuensis]